MKRFSMPGALLAAAVWLAPSAGAAEGSAKPAQARRPNTILIMADDLGREGLSCYGSLSYKTPNLDALAAGGTRFANAYSTPLCSPSRAAIMTGRYGFRTGWNQLIGRGGEDALEFFDPEKEKTFANVLKAAGYVTGITGKQALEAAGDGRALRPAGRPVGGASDRSRRGRRRRRGAGAAGGGACEAESLSAKPRSGGAAGLGLERISSRCTMSPRVATVRERWDRSLTLAARYGIVH